MEAKTPQVALVAVVLTYGGILAMLLALAAHLSFSGPIVGLVVFWIILCAALLPVSSTRLSTSGVSQLSIYGRRYVDWKDVSAARLDTVAITLKCPHGSLRIPLVLYADSEAAARFVLAQLPIEATTN